MKRIAIHGAGCALVDFLYSNVQFNSPAFTRYLSRRDGDGGLAPGKLVFAEKFEAFCGRPFADILAEITGGRQPDTLNLGGPAIVALINAAQILSSKSAIVRYFGVAGRDKTGDTLLSIARRTPLDISHVRRIDYTTPSTVVLSDPLFDNGHGERTFINTIGAAGRIRPDDLGDEFYGADIILFGSTALVPPLHDNLGALLRKAGRRGCVTVVTTVYDFRNQKKNPSRRWPLGENDKTYRSIDLLITDFEEAQRLSGCDSAGSAIDFFLRRGVSAVIITNGPRPVCARSSGKLFTRTPLLSLPVSQKRKSAQGDTTGCGDNFAGGVIASLAMQMGGSKRRREGLDPVEACSWGIASGAFTLSHVGGTYIEPYRGEKVKHIYRLYRSYRARLNVNRALTLACSRSLAS